MIWFEHVIHVFPIVMGYIIVYTLHANGIHHLSCCSRYELKKQGMAEELYGNMEELKGILDAGFEFMEASKVLCILTTYGVCVCVCACVCLCLCLCLHMCATTATQHATH